MRLLPELNSRAELPAVFVPADRFVMRVVPLVAGEPEAAQVQLALEALAPFPLNQLYWGSCVSPDRTAALVYASHRRRFSPEEIAAWEQADLVLPDLLPLLGAAPAAAGIVFQEIDGRIAGAAWDGRSAWPVAVLARAGTGTPTQEQRRQFAGELAARAGLGQVPAQPVAGTPAARRDGARLLLELRTDDRKAVTTLALPVDARDQLDIRDRDFLQKRTRERGREQFTWRALQAVVAIALVAALLETGGLALRLLGRVDAVRQTKQAPFVTKLETANNLAHKVDELGHRRLLFFEMLATINAARPHSIQFTRTVSNGRTGLEVEAQTTAAGDVGVYEGALRGLPALETVEVLDLRSRDGITSFRLAVNFRPDQGGTP